MHPVKASFHTADQSFPEGTVAVGFLLTLTQIVDTPPANADGTPGTAAAPIVMTGTAALTERTITIADVQPGTYQATIALVDANNTALAPAVTATAPITVPTAVPVSFPVPSALTLTLP